MQKSYTIDIMDTSFISDFLHDKEGGLKVAYYEQIKQFGQPTIQNFCLQNGYYGLPTWELVEWLKERIGDRSAIEVAAGHGALGRALGIPSTDSKIQETDYFRAQLPTGQKPVRYGHDVLKMEASEAVRHYRPDVVVCMWATQLWQPGYKTGFEHGVNFLDLVGRCQQVILIGNQWIHGTMEMVAKTTRATIKFPYLISRSKYTAMNRIYLLSK